MVKTSDLVADLRTCLRGECSTCGHECGNADCLDRIMEDAADRLEELVDRCARYAEEIAVLRGRQRWIPVTERLPEDRSNVLVVAYWHERWGVYMGWCAPERVEWCVHIGIGDRDDVAVTHWMPLPAAPEVE
nr:MAG TPA: Protein of unknown function (DUF551) [Caudoviricetes sp.]DAZ39533.1 MAG TPA: Protein of unknown function (DUF551) [Caudoviricetes sp.]